METIERGGNASAHCGFFAAAEAYDALQARVFPPLVEHADGALRLWVLGCGAGEAAYSLAIALLEHLETSARRPPFQVLATEARDEDLEHARRGLYGGEVRERVGAVRLRRFFVQQEGGFRVCGALRDLCVFGRHDPDRDVAFAGLDLLHVPEGLGCVRSRSAEELVASLHDALRGQGFLWLGEGKLDGESRRFELLDGSHGFYVRREPEPGSLLRVPRGAPGAREEVVQAAERSLLARYAPPAVVVDGDLRIVHIHGDARAFVRPPPGAERLDLYKSLAPGLPGPVRAAVQAARRASGTGWQKGVRLRCVEGWREVDVRVAPLAGASAAGLVVAFETVRIEGQASPARAAAAQAAVEDEPTEVSLLREGLQATRDYLQSIVEGLECANEELQCALEQTRSANHELACVNEDLGHRLREHGPAAADVAGGPPPVAEAAVGLRFELLADLAPLPMWACDRGGVRFVNRAFEQYVGLSEGDIRGTDGTAFVAAEDRSGYQARLAEAMLTQQPFQHRVRARRADGQVRCVNVVGRPGTGDAGRWSGYVGCAFDVTELVEAEEALTRLDRSKNEFLAMLAHELRNPLSGVRNASRLLREARDGAVVARAGEVIERQAAHMMRMAEELLDVTRITHGKIEVRPAPVDLAAVARRALEASDHERARRGQRLLAQIPESAVWVRGDAMRLEQVVANLLDNAVKYSPGGARIWCVLETESGEGRACAVLRVRDEGCGIEAGLLPRIFDLFVQADGAARQGGTRSGIGLGLALTRRLVSLHGGQVEAASAGPGKGAEFVVRLPMAAGPDEAQAAPDRSSVAAGAARRRVLVVDDHRDSAESLGLLLEMAGHEVRVLHDGASAAEEAQRFQADVVLLDIALPGMDGLAVARALRACEATRSVRIVAVSGYGGRDDIARSRAAGIEEHLTKPVDPDVLLALIARGA